MTNLLSGLSIALSSLQANQAAMSVVEHNVANANTPGYRRQSAVLRASQSVLYLTGPSNAVGGGVTVDMVRRYSDDLLDAQYRQYSGDASRWGTENDILTQVESLMQETDKNGSLTAQLDAFWSSWQTLSTDPTSLAYREDLLDKTQALVGSVNSRASMLISSQSDQNNSILSDIKEINTTAAQIADLNKQISHALSTNEQPNDLLDQRDQLLDRLADISGAKGNLQSDGTMMVTLGGHTLVVGTTSSKINEDLGIDSTGKTNLKWADNADFKPTTGELLGYIDARDNVIPGTLASLNQFATTLIGAVNNIHTDGYDLNGDPGTALLTGTNALDMRLAITDPELVAASSQAVANSGDGEIARQISALQNTQIFTNATANQFYNQMVTHLGLVIQQGQSDASSYKLAASALNSQRQSISGVSLDEEAANMVKFQRAYQAAAKVMSTVDDMLGTLMNM
jgi:flagellar hook-associated protein 1